MTDDGVHAKVCPVCKESMDTDHAWWWTHYGAVCSERCTRELLALRNPPHRA